MCGIHGFITGKIRNPNADDFVSNAFVAGSLRGTDSSGIASIDLDKNELEYQKLPLSGPMFIGERYAHQLISYAANINTITIAHTRSATSGKIGINEAHPFIVDDNDGRELIGVHNGTLTNWWNKKGAGKFKVDSEWALNHIFKEGADAFEDITGAFVFVWWDSKDEGFLNFALNDQRNMYVAFTKEDGLAYASEPGMLHWLCERNRITLTQPIMQLSAGHMYKFDVHKLDGFHKILLPKAKEVYTSPSSNVSNYRSHTPHKSVMAKVTELMVLIGDKPESKPSATQPTTALSLVPTTTGPRLSVMPHEAQTARELGLINEVGTFTPWWDDEDGDVFGLFTQPSGGEMDAVIRCAKTLEYEANTTVWYTTVIGAQDDGTTMTLVCDRPVCKVKPKEIAAVH